MKRPRHYRWFGIAPFLSLACTALLDMGDVNHDEASAGRSGSPGEAGRSASGGEGNEPGVGGSGATEPTAGTGNRGAGAAGEPNGDAGAENTEPTAGAPSAGTGGAPNGGAAGGGGGSLPGGQGGAPGAGRGGQSGGGAGGVQCDPGSGDCTSAPGCETSLTTNEHCGACGLSCPAPSYCRPQGVTSSCDDPARALNGQGFDMQCDQVLDAGRICQNLPAGSTTCPAMTGAVTRRVLTFGGDPAVTYDVVLRFRGVLENKIYMGGTADPDHFYVGGLPVPSAYNVYSVAVSAPAATYYLNSDLGAGELPNQVFAINYEKTLPIRGGASITLTSSDSDCRYIRNCVDMAAAVCVPTTVPGITVPPGEQIARIQVVSVRPRP